MDVHVFRRCDTLIGVNPEERDIEGRLIASAITGDAGSFASLANKYWEALVRFARSVCGEIDAEDAAQDALLVAWKKIGQLKNPEALFPWLIRITARICFRRMRFRFRFISLTHHPKAVEIPAVQPASTMDIERLLSRLAPRQRAVLHLTIIEGLSDREIGKALQITADSVRSHRRRAKDTLMKYCRQEYREDPYYD